MIKMESRTGTSKRNHRTKKFSFSFSSWLLLIMAKPYFTKAEVCPTNDFKTFKVANLSQSYWLFKAENQGCIGLDPIQSCDITLGFCHSLPQEVGCGSGTSSVCVQTSNVSGTKENFNAGSYKNSNPYHIVNSSPDKDFVAEFQGSTFTRKDNTKCNISTEIYFGCKKGLLWLPKAGETSTPVPEGAVQSASFNQTTCKYMIRVLFDGACPVVLPTDDTNLSLGSVLIIVFVVVVSTYFLFGCTFKYCYGFRGHEIIPHSGFWIDLPSLIVDGCAFTLKCGKTDMARTYDGI